MEDQYNGGDGGWGNIIEFIIVNSHCDLLLLLHCILVELMLCLTLLVLGNFLLTVYWGAFFAPPLFLRNYERYDDKT